MRAPTRWPFAALSLFVIAGCSNPFGRQYEYEERLYLSVDGSATVVINSSLQALQALRGISLGSIFERPDRDLVFRLLTGLGCPVTNVPRPWTRSGRHFIQIELTTEDVESLPQCPLLSWSRYTLSPTAADGGLRFEQSVGSPKRAVPEGGAGWRGDEIVAFRLHLPSRVRHQNIRRLDNGEAGEIERGNIGSWEQTLADRLAGKPVSLLVEMDASSILNRTLWLFAAALVAAVMTLGAAVWILRRRPRAT